MAVPNPTYFSQLDADNNMICTVEDLGTLSTDTNTSSKRKKGTVHVTVDSSTPTPAATKMGTIGTGTAAASAAAIGTTQVCLSVLLINTHATLTLKWGNSVTQPATLEAGGQQVVPASNVNQVYVIDGSGHATFAYIPEVIV